VWGILVSEQLPGLRSRRLLENFSLFRAGQKTLCEQVQLIECAFIGSQNCQQLSARMDENSQELNTFINCLKTKRQQLAHLDGLFVPPMFGFRKWQSNLQQLQEQLELSVLEVLDNEWMIHGIRLQLLCEALLKGHNIPKVSRTTGIGREKNSVTELHLITGETMSARACVIATGGFLGQGLEKNNYVTPPQHKLLDLSTECVQLGHWGIRTNRETRPSEDLSNVLYDNVFICGKLASTTSLQHTGSMDGVSLVTAMTAAHYAAEFTS